MAENIKDVNIAIQSAEDLRAYAIYVARCRAIPDVIDGLKPVIRKILWCAAHDFKGQGFYKTAKIMGQVIHKYNPHGDASVQLAIRNMINDFSTKIPTMDGSGSWGHKSNPYPAAPRYTECKISQFAIDVFIQDIYDDPRTTDWMNNYDNKCLEPCYLPAKIPALLVLGQLGIAVGMKSSIPSHSLAEVIDTTIGLMKNPNMPFCLIPDECMPCELHNTNFQKINDTGMGSYVAQGIIEVGEYDKHPALFVKSLPDFTFFDSIKESIIELVEKKKLPYVVDLISKSKVDPKTSKTYMNEVIILSKGSDPYFVKEFLYTNTAIRQTRQVKLITIKDNKLAMMNYREYLLNFIEFRRNTVFRKMNALLQKYKTAIHERETYIKAMTSGEIDNIIKMIRKQKTADDSELIEYFIEKLRITSLQARFLLNTDLKKLSKGNLDKYRKELKMYQEEEQRIMNIILNPKNIDQYIIDEMNTIKQKYASPRLCRVLSTSEAKGIPSGVFKLVFTKNGFVRKMTVDNPIGYMGNDEVSHVISVSNEEDILLFLDSGKVHRVSVYKIPLYAKGTNGVDLRVINKYLTSSIVSVAREDTLKSLCNGRKFKNFIFVLSDMGFIKKMDIEDILTTPSSGLIYSKLDGSDKVNSILFGPDKLDLIVYNESKILRFSAKEAPYLKRSTKGNKVMGSDKIKGMNLLLPTMDKLVIISKDGMVNLIPTLAIPVQNRSRSGNKCMKLKKGDSILSIWPCNIKDVLTINDIKNIKRIPIESLQMSSTVSMGTKLLESPYRVSIE